MNANKQEIMRNWLRGFPALVILLVSVTAHSETDNEPEIETEEVTFDSHGAEVALDIGLGADLKKIATLTGLDTVQSYSITAKPIGLFVWKDGKFNDPTANKETFNAAVENITAEKIKTAEALLVAKTEKAIARSLAFICLAGASSKFVEKRGKIHREAFDEALRNITQTKITQAQRLINDPKTSEPLMVLLSAAGHFVDGRGRFDKTAFNKALDGVTLEDVEATLKGMKKKDRDEALYLILRNRAPHSTVPQ